MEENPEDAIITEEREELMVSPSGKNPTRRPAHFLKPSVTSIKGPVFHLPSGTFLSPPSTTRNSIDLPLKVEFRGCRETRDPLKRWKSWFDRMHSLHQSTWKNAGIYEAIVSSTYQIRIDKEMVMNFAEKWCPDTNTFVFDWGEGTITLEDVMVLGGFSVLGNSVLMPLETRESIEIDKKLMEGRREITRGKANKASQGEWAKLFMESGSDIEHEAFLALWLSRHVFPNSVNIISKNVLSIAIHLARGRRIALAPAVLSWIYRDLRLLKNAIYSKKKGNVGVNLWAPMQIVQIWAWERFPTLTPQPNLLKPGEPRMAKWNKMKKKKNIENVGLALSSSGEYFQWRPYAITEKNWVFPKFYKESEERVSVCLGIDEDFESFGLFLRPCELVGLDCLECYLPHRVAMQFGMDQDLPGLVTRLNGTPEIAWENYTRPIKERLYVPSRLFKSGVTTRYLEWWKQSKLAKKDAVNGAEAEKTIAESLRKPPENPKGKNVEKSALGTPPERKRVKPMKSGGKDEKSITKSPIKLFQIPKRMNVENDALRSPPKRKWVNKEAKPVGQDKHRLVDGAGNRMSGDVKCVPRPQHEIPLSLSVDNCGGKKMGSPVEHVENAVRGEATMRGSHKPSENTIEGSLGIPSEDGVSITNNGWNISAQNTTVISGLEVRTSKLEMVFARLKAKKLGVRSI